MNTARAHLYASGRVQGVFFRAFTRNIAAALGLSGWVRNLCDGRVEAVFEGRRDLIEQAIGECRRGPAGAHVEQVEVIWENFTGEFHGFDVRH